MVKNKESKEIINQVCMAGMTKIYDRKDFKLLSNSTDIITATKEFRSVITTNFIGSGNAFDLIDRYTLKDDHVSYKWEHNTYSTREALRTMLICEYNYVSSVALMSSIAKYKLMYEGSSTKSFSANINRVETWEKNHKHWNPWNGTWYDDITKSHDGSKIVDDLIESRKNLLNISVDICSFTGVAKKTCTLVDNTDSKEISEINKLNKKYGIKTSDLIDVESLKAGKIDSNGERKSFNLWALGDQPGAKGRSVEHHDDYRKCIIPGLTDLKFETKLRNSNITSTNVNSSSHMINGVNTGNMNSMPVKEALDRIDKGFDRSGAYNSKQWYRNCVENNKNETKLPSDEELNQLISYYNTENQGFNGDAAGLYEIIFGKNKDGKKRTDCADITINDGVLNCEKDVLITDNMGMWKWTDFHFPCDYLYWRYVQHGASLDPDNSHDNKSICSKEFWPFIASGQVCQGDAYFGRFYSNDEKKFNYYSLFKYAE